MTDYSGFVEGAVTTLKGAISENNVRAERITNANNSQALVFQYREEAETDDATILTYRQKFQQAEEAILKWQNEVDAYILEKGYVSTEAVDVEAETVAWRESASTIKAMTKVLVTLPGGEDAAKDLPEVKGIPGARVGGGSSTGTRRPRFSSISYTVAGTDNWVDVSKTEGEGEDAVSKTNLTLLAGVLSTKEHKVAASDLQAPMFDAAGTGDLSTLAGKPVEFGFSVGDVNYIVRVTPRVEA